MLCFMIISVILDFVVFVVVAEETVLQVLKWEDMEIGDPKEGEIRVKNMAIGVNFIDIYYRTGVYKVPEIPYTPGFSSDSDPFN